MKDPIRKLDAQSPTATQKSVRFVVAALILREISAEASAPATTEVLVCQRRPDQPMSLKWEFPGGKIEPGESSEVALARELNEELGIDAIIGRRVARTRHKYRSGGAVDLQFFLVTDFRGPLENRIFNDLRWSPLPELTRYDFLAADPRLVRDLADGKLL